MSTRSGSTLRNDHAEEIFFGFLTKPPDEDPYENYHWLHENAPVFETTGGMIVLSRFADVDAALRHRSLGRGKESVLHLIDLPRDLVEPVMSLWKRTMIFANPPLHTRMRRKVTSEFAPRHAEAMRERVSQRALELLNNLADAGEGNFVRMVGSPLGGTAVADLLGIPLEDRAELQVLSPNAMKVFDPMTAIEDLRSAAEAQIRMAEYFRDQFDDRRAHPRDDMLTRLVYPSDGEPLEEIELIATAANLMNAGNDSAVNLLGNSVHALLTHPDQLELLREDPSRIPRAVEELARFDPPLNLNPHTALAPCTVAGVDLEPDTIVVSIQGAANRDAARFTDPDRLDLLRDEGPSMTFGGGIHYCAGAHLGRIEMHELLHHLVTKFSTVELAGPGRRRPGHNLRGFTDLPVRLRRQ